MNEMRERLPRLERSAGGAMIQSVSPIRRSESVKEPAAAKKETFWFN